MYYSPKQRDQKVKELENNKEFMKFAQKHYDECRAIGMYEDQPFDKYLAREVFTLFDNFSMMQFLNTTDKKTVNKVLEEALKGL